MTRTQYDELSATLVRTMLDMEDDILREIAAQLSRDENISDTSKWRIRQLARAGRFDKRAASLIAGYSEVQNEQAMDMILAAAETEIGYLDEAVRAANTAGLSEYFSDIPAETSALNAAKAFQKQAASDMNLVNTVMQYKAKAALIKAVNDTYLEGKKRQQVLDTMGKHSASLVMGQMSLQQATRRCIKELAQKGIPAFVDKSGREWSPEAYVMMDMRSTLGNTARAAQDMRCDQYGISLISVSSHMGARPLCALYQGRIFSRDGTSGVTTDGNGREVSFSPLSETSYGLPAGLFGINCGHVQYPFIPGINIQRYFPYPEEENSKRYEQLQRQRYLERQIRATKRECMMLNEVGDKEGLQKASLRLRNQRSQYRQFCKGTGLREHGDRTQVLGFDRSVSSKTVWAERKAQNLSNSNVKPLDNGGGSGIIRTEQQSDLGIFKQKIQSDKRITQEYYSVIKGKFSHGSDVGKRLFNKYVPTDSVENAVFEGTPQYNTDKKRIFMHFNTDMHNERGNGATWFHEHGHLIDDYAGRISNDNEFRRIIEEDVRQYRMKIGKENNLKTFDKVDKFISSELKDFRKHSAVSDIFEGATKGNIVGCGGHGRDYWQKDDSLLTSEAFAHMYEAQFDKTRYNEMQKYFPNSLRYIEKKMEDYAR